MFSSPFIEERLYFDKYTNQTYYIDNVLVPFYRGAVVFVVKLTQKQADYMFSSPFIEERLYL